MGKYDLKEAVKGDLGTFLQRRTDVKAVIDMSHVEFHEWYRQRKEASERLLRDYKLASDIPSFEPALDGDILYVRNNKTQVLAANISSLEAGLEYLEMIKDMREKGFKNSEL